MPAPEYFLRNIFAFPNFFLLIFLIAEEALAIPVYLLFPSASFTLRH
jgi:hypothetical protein